MGFVLGSAHPQKLRREILAHAYFKTLAAIGSGVMRKPSTLRFLLSSLRPGDKGYDSQAAELTYLAVDENQRLSGIGRQLVEHFSQKLIESGARAFELSVDTDNHQAIGFYERLGFVEVCRYRKCGIDHKRYRMELA